MLRFVAIVIGIFVLVGAALTGSYVFDAYLARPDSDEEKTFVVEEGDSANRIAWKLNYEGFITSPSFFTLYARMSGSQDDFKPGTFSLRPGMSFAAIVDALTRAESDEVQVTIPEGFTLKQIGERVREALPHVTEEEWNVAVGASSPVLANSFFLNQTKPAGVDLEGYLFPDTYRFFSDATAVDVVTIMVGTMETKLTAAFATTGEEFVMSGRVHELLTLASIVEREVQGAEDMKYVADIFLSRLEIGMPLQADSTISYYLGKTSAELTLEDLKADEPFNTYTRAGLPPGPISNPGMNAIDAVLRPIENPYLYFLTTSDGTVIYASTFEEHVANKNRYLR